MALSAKAISYIPGAQTVQSLDILNV